jgi:hypothetical protein
MIDDVNVFASSFVAFCFEEQSAIIISSCRQEFIQLFNVSSSCEKETLFLSHEENTMNTMISSSREENTINTIMSLFDVKNIETSSSIVENTVISSIQTKDEMTSLSREEESTIVSLIDDEFDANLLNEIALFTFSFIQIKTIKKTSITNVFKHKFNKKINDKFKKVIKKLLKDNKNKKYFVERRF